MASLNKVILIGRLTRDPELQKTNGGTSVAKVGMAVDDGWGEKKTTVFVDVTIWGKSAEFTANYCRKGAQVSIEGRLSLDTWDDRNTGQKRYKLYVTADNIQSLENREQQPQQQYQQTAQQAPQAPAAPAPPPPFQPPATTEPPVDDIPY